MVGEGALRASAFLRNEKEVATLGTPEAERAASDTAFSRRRMRGEEKYCVFPENCTVLKGASPTTWSHGLLDAGWTSAQDG